MKKEKIKEKIEEEVGGQEKPPEKLEEEIKPAEKEEKPIELTEEAEKPPLPEVSGPEKPEEVIELTKVVEEPPPPELTGAEAEDKVKTKAEAEPEQEPTPPVPRRSIKGVPRDISKSPALPWIVVALLVVFGIISTIGWVGGYRRVEELKTAVAKMTKETEVAKVEVRKVLKLKGEAEAKIKDLEETLEAAKIAVPAVVVAAPAAPVAPVAPAAPAAPVAPTKAEKFKLATIGKGEGIEHAFIRQLVADPEIVKGVKIKVLGKVYDLTFKGDKSNAKELKKWAGWAADLIAQNQGYVNFATGREIRVKVANRVAYVLEKAGDSVIIGEYEKDAEGNFKDSPSDAKQSSGDEMSLFEGDTSAGVQKNYEYVYTPSASAQSSNLTINIGPITGLDNLQTDQLVLDLQSQANVWQGEAC